MFQSREEASRIEIICDKINEVRNELLVMKTKKLLDKCEPNIEVHLHRAISKYSRIKSNICCKKKEIEAIKNKILFYILSYSHKLHKIWNLYLSLEKKGISMKYKQQKINYFKKEINVELTSSYSFRNFNSFIMLLNKLSRKHKKQSWSKIIGLFIPID